MAGEMMAQTRGMVPAIEAADAGAACLRNNPGNIGSLDRIKEDINSAKNVS